MVSWKYSNCMNSKLDTINSAFCLSVVIILLIVCYPLQNDLIHAWGLDIQLGYCSQVTFSLFFYWLPFRTWLVILNRVETSIQGDRVKKVGVVDAEYVVHMALPTLGVSSNIKASITQNSLPTCPLILL